MTRERKEERAVLRDRRMTDKARAKQARLLALTRRYQRHLKPRRMSGS